LTRDNVVLYAMSTLIVNQFIGTGSRYGITRYHVSNILKYAAVECMGLISFNSDGLDLGKVGFVTSLMDFAL